MRKASPWLRFIYCLSFSLLVFGSIWYYQSAETPPWKQEYPASPATAATPRQPTPSRASAKKQIPFRFVAYNLKNWLTSNQNPEKSSDSKKAIIQILASTNADVIGLSEIGSVSDVREIQNLLKKAGQNLPHFHHTGGTDPIRHLALLSRFPITSTHRPDITIRGTGHSLQRGLLDTSIEINGQTVRFLGMHLKSKRTVPNYDQAELRIREAQHIRKHIDSILSKNPDTRLIAYGDFNDHIRSLSTRTLLGHHNSSLYLNPVHVTDSRGEKWTHSFNSHDTYSRIDFITVSKSLKSNIDRENSRIIDTPNWELASDHRAILVSFR
jgi:endonuclease/exonuclease/phosphatase family metal-dependent hydrolase